MVFQTTKKLASLSGYDHQNQITSFGEDMIERVMENFYIFWNSPFKIFKNYKVNIKMVIGKKTLLWKNLIQ